MGDRDGSVPCCGERPRAEEAAAGHKIPFSLCFFLSRAASGLSQVVHCKEEERREEAESNRVVVIAPKTLLYNGRLLFDLVWQQHSTVLTVSWWHRLSAVSLPKKIDILYFVSFQALTVAFTVSKGSVGE